MLRASRNIQHFKKRSNKTNYADFQKYDFSIHNLYFLDPLVGRYPRTVGCYRSAVGRYRTKVPKLVTPWLELLGTSKISRIDPIIAELCSFEKRSIFSEQIWRIFDGFRAHLRSDNDVCIQCFSDYTGISVTFSAGGRFFSIFSLLAITFYFQKWFWNTESTDQLTPKRLRYHRGY